MSNEEVLGKMNHIMAYVADLLAIYAEIESYKAENMERESRGCAPAYGEKEFDEKRAAAAHIAETLRMMF